jgi:hypothetical protein
MPNKPTARDLEAAQRWLRSNGRCGSKHQDGHLCTLMANHTHKKHKAQIMGGVEDGRTLKEWDW